MGSALKRIKARWDASSSFYGGSLADDYYQLAVKIHDVYAYYSENNELTQEERIEWEIYKISLDGVIDSSETTRTFSIIPWEPKFDQDMNDDLKILDMRCSLFFMISIKL